MGLSLSQWYVRETSQVRILEITCLKLLPKRQQSIIRFNKIYNSTTDTKATKLMIKK